jgi:hypothetical protein
MKLAKVWAAILLARWGQQLTVFTQVTDLQVTDYFMSKSKFVSVNNTVIYYQITYALHQ